MVFVSNDPKSPVGRTACRARLTAASRKSTSTSFLGDDLLDYAQGFLEAHHRLRLTKRTLVSLASRLRFTFPGTNQLIISILIAGLGWVSGQALSHIDQDLPSCTPSTHWVRRISRISPPMSSAIATRSFDRWRPKPEHLRTDHGIPAGAAGANPACSGSIRRSRSARVEADGAKKKDIQAVRESLDQYFRGQQNGRSAVSPQKGGRQDRWRKRRNSAKKPKSMPPGGGPKVMQVSLALDRLLETVADVAKDMREAGTKTIYPRVIGSWAGASLLRC